MLDAQGVEVINEAYHLSLPAGTVLEEYRIISVLGQGSFGLTYLAEDVNLGTRLAIKEYLPSDWAFRDSTQTVRPKNSALSESFERGQDYFLKEARLLAQVVHPNIVKVRRFFRAHGTAYIAMDFIGGRSLGDMLNEDYRDGGYPSVALKRLLVAVLGGLSALHQRRIIHRDIKPSNVVLEPNGNPMLVDFGSARNFDPALAGGMTVIVTPGYAPIEQYSEDREQGPFTDIYALGALAYRAITGHPPDAPYKRFNSNSSLPAAIVGAGKYPAPLLEAIDWALAVRPQNRPQSAEELLAKLRAVPDDVMAEPTQILGEAAGRWRGASGGKSGIVSKEPRLRSDGVSMPQSLSQQPEIAAGPQRRAKRAKVLLAVLLFIGAVGGGAYHVLVGFDPGTAITEDAATSSKAKAERQAAAKAEADRQAAAKSEADRRAAAQTEAERQAAAKAEAARAAAKAEADRQAAAKAEADRQAAAQAEAGRQAAAKAEADRQAAAKAETDRQAAAQAEAERQGAAKAEADRQAAAKAETDRQAAAKFEAKRRAATKGAETDRQKAGHNAPAPAENQQAASVARPKNTKHLDTASTAPSDATRCRQILQNAQLTEQISNDEKNFLREHCH